MSILIFCDFVKDMCLRQITVIRPGGNINALHVTKENSLIFCLLIDINNVRHGEVHIGGITLA